MAEYIEREDARRVEVVKCEDCKHRDSCTGQLTFCVRDHVLELNVYKYPQLEFCSYGERRESDETD